MAASAEHGSGGSWMFPIIGSSLCWALADLVCDVVIGEDLDECSGGAVVGAEPGEDDLERENQLVETTLPSVNILPPTDSTTAPMKPQKQLGGVLPTASGLVMQIMSTSSVPLQQGNNGDDMKPMETSPFSGNILPGGLFKRNRSGSQGSQNIIPNFPVNVPMIQNNSDENLHMNGNQECAISGSVTLVIVYLMGMQRWTSHAILRQESVLMDNVGVGMSAFGFLWSPLHNYEWWVAACGGCLLFYHYLVLYWAHETAPSTVINPLLQVSSTWLLLGSAIPAMINNSTYIEPFDLLCYAIVVFGGMLPSLNGNMKAMTSLKFWKRDFVRYSFLSEFTIGVYDLLLSSVLRAHAAKGAVLDSDDQLPILDHGALENEFFFVAWCWFGISFTVCYSLNPKLRQEFIGIWRLPVKIIFFSAFGQIMTLAGYYLSQFAYSLFYQVSVVHGAEASLGQAFNLITAFVAKKGFNIGRDSAVSNMKVKIVSVMFVALGLGLLAHREMLSETQNRRRVLMHSPFFPNPNP